MDLFSKLPARHCLILLAFLITNLARSQTISLSVKDESIEKIFLLVETQTDYSFIYSSESIAKANPVTLSVKNEPIEDFLKLVFLQQPLAYHIRGKHITVRLQASSATNSKVTGKVITDDNEPVAGASVLNKSNQQSTATNEAGEFSLSNFKVGDVLEITGAEIESQQIVARNNNITIRVRPKLNTLDETIVIAYGNTTRRLATGTVSKLAGSEIQKQPVSNPLLAMSGRITGLQITQGSGVPGSNVTVRLRGQNSIANGNDPLYIVDGVPFPSSLLATSLSGASAGSNPLNNINPNDIESIEVLKDADATAIYGSRAANGVILITTKKGKPGVTRTELSYHSGWSKVTRTMPLMNTSQYLAMRREAFANDQITPTSSNAADLLFWDTTRYTDWQKLLFGNTARSHHFNGSVSGGNALTQFLVSTTYHNETTVYAADFGEKKFSGHASLQHATADRRFKFSLQTSYTRTHINLPQQDAFQSTQLAPNAPALYDSSGKLNWENSTWINPLATMKRIFRTSNDNFINNVQLSYSILPFVQLKTSLGYSLLTTDESNATPSSSINPAGTINRIARFSNSSMRSLIAEPQIVFDKKFRDLHLQALGGATFQYSVNQGKLIEGSGYTTDDLLQSLSAASSIRTINEVDTRYRYAGVLARINGNYKRKYLLTLTARRDGSSRFGPSNRFANFGSLALGWIFSQESFASKLFPFLSFGKIKGSIGTTGNDQIGEYNYLNTYDPSGDSYLGVSTLVPTQLYNPDYGWEQVRKAEVSIDLGFFKDRVLFSANLYDNRTTNQLLNYGLPSSTGFSGVLLNMPAVIRNYGMELELSYTILQQSAWKWKTSLQLSIPRNKLVSFRDLDRSPYANFYRTGQSLFIVRRYGFAGVDDSTGVYQFTDVDKDGIISNPSDYQTALYTGQQYFGGMHHSLSYKNFNLTVFVQFVRQKHANSWQFLFGRPGLAVNQPVWVLDRWQASGDAATYQRYSVSNSATNTAYNFFRSSEAAFADASFIRLKTVYASWSPTLFRKSPGLSTTIFMQAQNLFTLTNYKGADPETKTLLPPLRTITAGIQIKL